MIPSLGIQSLAVLCQTGAGGLVLVHAVVLHHAVEQSHEVRVLPRVAAHPADVGTGPVIRVTLGEGGVGNIIFPREIKFDMSQRGN